jgi:hypothetical protein
MSRFRDTTSPFEPLASESLARATGGQFAGAAAMMRAQNAVASSALESAGEGWSLGCKYLPDAQIVREDGVLVHSKDDHCGRVLPKAKDATKPSWTWVI